VVQNGTQFVVAGGGGAEVMDGGEELGVVVAAGEGAEVIVTGEGLGAVVVGGGAEVVGGGGGKTALGGAIQNMVGGGELSVVVAGGGEEEVVGGGGLDVVVAGGGGGHLGIRLFSTGIDFFQHKLGGRVIIEGRGGLEEKPKGCSMSDPSFWSRSVKHVQHNSKLVKITLYMTTIWAYICKYFPDCN
jgi:hypothetical protein